MDLNQKSAVVEELKGILGAAKAVVLLSQKGLTVDQGTQFRRALRKEGGQFRVIKNTLFARAVAGTAREFLSDMLKGPLAIAYTQQEPVSLAKALTTFLKGTQQLAVVGGTLGSRPISVADLKTLATLPGIEVMKGMLLGAFVAVPQKFLGVLQAPARDFVGVLAARERQLSGQA
jgi:large subunit ribosomal protein L10